jgi:hypothetical protein
MVQITAGSLHLTMTLRLLLVSMSLMVSYGFSSPSARYRPVLMRPSLVTRHMIFSTQSKTDRDQIVQQLLALSRRIGPVGSLATVQDQQALEQLAMTLEPLSDKNPTKRPLRGMHNLLYSAAPGGSSGRLAGPFYGKVTQDFVDDETFINAVQFGPLQISLRATRSVKTARRNMVKFCETTVRLFGQTIVQKELGGGGVWDYIFIGEVTDEDGTSKLIRVMKTPSLFVLEQNL